MLSAGRDVERLAWEWDISTTHRARIKVLLEAQGLVRVLDRSDERQTTPDPACVRGTREFRLAVIADDRGDLEVARAYGLNRTTVWRWRKAGVAHLR